MEIQTSPQRGWHHSRQVAAWSMTLAIALIVLGAFGRRVPVASAAIGDQVFATGGDITVTVEPATAGFTSDLYLYTAPNAGASRTFIAQNSPHTPAGTTIDLGTFPAGQELYFAIVVHDGSDHLFFIGPASRNPDGIAHANVVFISPGVYNIGFEDLYGGGDRDYNDNIFEFTGIIPAPPTATTLTYTGDTTADYHDTTTLSAVLQDTHGNKLSGETISFTLGSQSCAGTTDATGTASCTIASVSGTPGPTTVMATFAGDGNDLSSNSGAQPFTITKEETTTTYTGPTTSDYHDLVTVSATLKEDGTTPIGGATISFTLGTGGGSQVCSGITDATGNASCSVTPTDAAGPATIQASFAGNTNYLPSSVSEAFTITKEETTLQYTGPTAFANGFPTTLSAVLKEDGTTPLATRTVTLTLGSQSCTGTTNASGAASCNLTPNQPAGPTTVTASFAGDADYLPASVSQPVVLASFATAAGGTFVVGDKSATGNVSFWGAQWAGANSLSGGSAPDSFKGFAATPSTNPPSCGGTWTTGPGNSANPPSSVPGYVVVIVSSTVSKSGSTITGNIVQLVVVKTDPGYAGNPGHAGTGTVVGVLCTKP
jgi:uncharacterized protein DUF4114